MKVAWVCGLMSLLVIVAYGRLTIPRSDAEGLRFEAAVLPLHAASPWPGAMPVSTNANNDIATDLLPYVYLHQTRISDISTLVEPRADACLE